MNHSVITRLPPPQRQRGLTLFELVVYILVVAIIFAVAFNRFRGLPLEAERASFTGTLMQIKSGINMQMMTAIASGNWHELQHLDGSNPMNLMLEVPSNYIGEFTFLQSPDLPGHTWYFDSAQGELVYLASNNDRLFAIIDGAPYPISQLRFRLTMHYTEGERPSWEGITLEAVYPYEWDSTIIDYTGGVR